MSSSTLNEFLFDILLIGLGCYMIIKEKEFIKIEKKIFRVVKRMVKK